LGKLYTDMSGAYWFLRRPQDGIDCLEKSIAFFNQTEHALNSVIAYNNLGINLLLIGEWQRAEQMIRRAFKMTENQENAHTSGVLDSLGELKLLRGETDEAEKLFNSAIEMAKASKRGWYEIQSMRNLARCYFAQGRGNRAITTANSTIELSKKLGDKHFASMAGLVLAEAYLVQGDLDACEAALADIEMADPAEDFFVLGNVQRIRGLTALEEKDVELAIHHFSRGLTIFEAAGDLYNTGSMHHLLGSHLDVRDAKRAKQHLNNARDIFRKLGVNGRVAEIAKDLEKLEVVPKQEASRAEKRSNSVVSQLLTVRLAEATASRELLFRELVAVLQQESNAKRIMIAQYNDEKRLYPFITHGYSPIESNELASKLNAAIEKNEEKQFARAKNVALFHLKGSAAQPAILIVNPQSGAVLSDESSLQPLLRVLELGMDVIALRERDKSQPAEAEASPYTSSSLMPGFIHSSPAMTSLVEEVYKIRSSDVTVLVTGESGTGKELVSRAIHTLSNRKDKIFVPFNCTAVPKELAEGHLFGYKKGSFTGAVNDHPGMIRTADGGTLFLDEVGDLPLDVQPKLLRFLQEGEIQPIGEKKPIKVDVRIIAATNMPLEEKVEEGTFREDLYYRLNVIRLRVPPLRERRSEIPPIVNYYVNHYSERFGKHDVTFTPQVVDMLMVCSWDGNVRQLCNEIQRIVARAVDKEVITPEHLSPELKRAAQPLTPFATAPGFRPIATYDGGGSFAPFASLSNGGSLEEAVSELEMQLIRGALMRHNWNISRVASELGLTRRGLYLKLARYGIEKAA
ncbi:MAG: sigma 54-interacting transcriptional regulator, partial [Pyrinomonadaceae bacterium]